MTSIFEGTQPPQNKAVFFQGQNKGPHERVPGHINAVGDVPHSAPRIHQEGFLVTKFSAFLGGG